MALHAVLDPLSEPLPPEPLLPELPDPLEPLDPLEPELPELPLPLLPELPLLPLLEPPLELPLLELLPLLVLLLDFEGEGAPPHAAWKSNRRAAGNTRTERFHENGRSMSFGGQLNYRRAGTAGTTVPRGRIGPAKVGCNADSRWLASAKIERCP